MSKSNNDPNGSEAPVVSQHEEKTFLASFRKIFNKYPKLVYSLVFLILLWFAGVYYFDLLYGTKPEVLSEQISNSIADAEGDLQLKQVADLSKGKEISVPEMLGIYRLNATFNAASIDYDTRFPILCSWPFDLLVTNDTTFYILEDPADIRRNKSIGKFKIVEQFGYSSSSVVMKGVDSDHNECILAVDINRKVTPYYYNQMPGAALVRVNIDLEMAYFTNSLRTVLLQSALRQAPNATFPPPDTILHSTGRIQTTGLNEGEFVAFSRLRDTLKIYTMTRPSGVMDLAFSRPYEQSIRTSSLHENMLQINNLLFGISDGEVDELIQLPDPNERYRIVGTTDDLKLIVRTPSSAYVLNEDYDSILQTIRGLKGTLLIKGDFLYDYSTPNQDEGFTGVLARISPNGSRKDVNLKQINDFSDVQFIQYKDDFAFVGSFHSELPSFLVTVPDTTNYSSVDVKIINPEISADSLRTKVHPNRFVILVVLAFVICLFIFGFNIVTEPLNKPEQPSPIYAKIPTLKEKADRVDVTLTNLRIRYNTMLYLGIAIGIFGIGGFLIMIENYSVTYDKNLNEIDWISLIRPTTLLLFIETLSFFFLRQYRIIFQEYKVFFSTYLRITNYFNALDVHEYLKKDVDADHLVKQILADNYALMSEKPEEAVSHTYKDIIKQIIDKKL